MKTSRLLFFHFMMHFASPLSIEDENLRYINNSFSSWVGWVGSNHLPIMSKVDASTIRPHERLRIEWKENRKISFQIQEPAFNLDSNNERWHREFVGQAHYPLGFPPLLVDVFIWHKLHCRNPDWSAHPSTWDTMFSWRRRTWFLNIYHYHYHCCRYTNCRAGPY